MAAAPRLPLLREAGAQSCKFGVADRTCLFQPIQFFYFICDAETDHAPEFITGRLSLLDIAFRHASSLKNQICKHGDVWKYYPAYYPVALIQPEMSWRRNRSDATVMSSQNHTMKKNIARASSRKFR